MKVLLILPDGHIHKIKIGGFSRSMREAPLTLTTLAAMAPKELDIEFKLVDESIDKVPLDYPADLVGISVLTGTSNRAYELADYFRKQGKTVVLGGVHITLMPEEARKYADSILIGSAEHIWGELLYDFKNGNLKKEYNQIDTQTKEGNLNIPFPNRCLQRSSGYMVANTVMATVGCKRACEFCTIPALGRGYFTRPISDVIEDIKTIKSKLIAFNDVSLVDDREYAKELFKAMIPLKKTWGGLATTDIHKDKELLELMYKSGCKYLLLGFESFNAPALKEISKGFNKGNEYKELMETLHSYGISVQGCFIFGFDDDKKDIFEKIVQQVVELKIDIPRYSILTPYPQTGLYKRLIKENRMLSFNWQDYDTMHIVFEPANMTPDELYGGFKWAYKETFKIGNIAKRLPLLKFNGAINFVGNLAYKKFVWQLYNSERYKYPYTKGEQSICHI